MVLISDDGIPAARRRPGQAVFREQEASSAKTVVAQARAARPARTWPTSSSAAAAFGCAVPYTRFCRTRFSSASASASPWFPVAQSACAMLYVRRNLTSESRARPAAFRRASLSNPSAAAASPRESRRPARFEAAS